MTATPRHQCPATPVGPDRTLITSPLTPVGAGAPPGRPGQGQLCHSGAGEVWPGSGSGLSPRLPGALGSATWKNRCKRQRPRRVRPRAACPAPRWRAIRQKPRRAADVIWTTVLTSASGPCQPGSDGSPTAHTSALSPRPGFLEQTGSVPGRGQRGDCWPCRTAVPRGRWQHARQGGSRDEDATANLSRPRPGHSCQGTALLGLTQCGTGSPVTQPGLGLGTWACRLSGPVATPPIPTVRTVDTCAAASPHGQPGGSSPGSHQPGFAGTCPSPWGRGRPLAPTASQPCHSRPLPTRVSLLYHAGVCAGPGAGSGAGGTRAVQGAGCAARGPRKVQG